jgi:prophage regulatory protein
MSSPIKVVQSAPNPVSKSAFDSLPDSTFLRVNQLVLPRKSTPGIFAILPMSAATLWRKVAAGTFPEPRKLSSGMTAWVVGDIRRWLREQAAGCYIPACKSAVAKMAERAALPAGTVLAVTSNKQSLRTLPEPEVAGSGSSLLVEDQSRGGQNHE